MMLMPPAQDQAAFIRLKGALYNELNQLTEFGESDLEH